MGHIHPAEPAKLIVGMLSAFTNGFDAARDELIRHYGTVDIESDPIPFSFTSYYEQEVGPNLLRKFLAFERLIDPAILADVKLLTNRLEAELAPAIAAAVPRPINIDPGYITPAKLVLASTKDFSHRIYLRDGIYAEVTLHYEKGGTFRGWPWTFPDFKTNADYHAFLLRARRRCVEQLRALRHGS
ncbi:MAG TPA: DUF4416 family protein [Planctomycetota bacterium]|nr:DUF4416 family protein [Planctomycetota bacterium]